MTEAANSASPDIYEILATSMHQEYTQESSVYIRQSTAWPFYTFLD
jgi:hypothetical protein